MKMIKQVSASFLRQSCRGLWLVITFSLSLTFSALAISEIYQTTDKDGNAVFSDIKTDRSEPVTLQPTNTTTLPKLDTSNSFETDSSQEIPASYTSLLIQSPLNDETIRNTVGNVNVSVQVTPTLLANHGIQILVDGTAITKPLSNTHFQFGGIERGVHQLTAQIIDLSDGSVVETSPSVQIHLKQHSASH
ncbi:MAG: DUF4124 domain-containing protein [Pseudomonadales bacterium]|nr:DUF4124 domain-containing protein [Pseudomonadales bacterium]